MLWCPYDKMNSPIIYLEICSLFSLSALSFMWCSCPLFCLCFAQVASVLLQCLAALPLSGDPLGLEGCQHSVQPQPFQALWAQREAKCSARGQQQPALEDLGKPGKTTFLHDKIVLGYFCFNIKNIFSRWLVSSKCPWFVCLKEKNN